MPKISKEESDARRNEIIDACGALYQSESYHDITMTQIASRVSFGRANVYNYFQCKDEILLALLQREHELWAADLAALSEAGGALDEERLAGGIAKSVQSREQMLKLLAMNLYDIEQNSSFESLVEFKGAYSHAIEALRGLLAVAMPRWSRGRIDEFVYSFMPFLHGVYPYAFHSKKQQAAMDEAGIAQPKLTIYSMSRSFVLRMLRSDE